MNIKCIGCPELTRKELRQFAGLPWIVYQCSRFPYSINIRGLMRPQSKLLLKAVESCPMDIANKCAVCSGEAHYTYGHPDNPIAYSCKEHYEAWDKWLKEHPERRNHLAPRGRAIKANWVEVFREFVQEEQEGQP